MRGLHRSVELLALHCIPAIGKHFVTCEIDLAVCALAMYRTELQVSHLHTVKQLRPPDASAQAQHHEATKRRQPLLRRWCRRGLGRGRRRRQARKEAWCMHLQVAEPQFTLRMFRCRAAVEHEGRTGQFSRERSQVQQSQQRCGRNRRILVSGLGGGGGGRCAVS